MASETKAGEAEAEQEISEQQVIAHYKALRTEIQRCAAKISELEQDLTEHHFVAKLNETMAGMEKQASDWQKKYNIRTPQEMQQQQAAQQLAQPTSGPSVLA
eukprot:g182.t1